MHKIKVYIDCGHGGKDSGAVNGSFYEKNVTLPVGIILKELLEETGRFEVKLSRNYDTYLTLEQRSKDANNWGADIFISIHTNSATKKDANGVTVMDTKPNGIETFCYLFKYRKLADAIHQGILDKKVFTKNRGVKEGNFHVIRETKMSACLVELAFISNSEDKKLLETKQRSFAEGMFDGVLNYYGIKIESSKPKYIVATGAYNNKENALKDVEELKKKGFTGAYIHTC